jgi:hypothetical protein
VLKKIVEAVHQHADLYQATNSGSHLAIKRLGQRQFLSLKSGAYLFFPFLVSIFIFLLRQ